MEVIIGLTCGIVIFQTYLMLVMSSRIESLEDSRNYIDSHSSDAESLEEDTLLKEFDNVEYADKHADDERLSINERVLLREEAFNKRIEKMKSPAPISRIYTSNKQANVTYSDEPYDIPHEAVDATLNALPDVEETD